MKHVPMLLYLLMGLPVVFIGFNTDFVAYFVGFFQEPASMIGLLLLFTIFPAFAWNHPHRMTRVCARVVVMSALAVLIEMWMQVFGDGQRDMIKHLYLANLCFDMMLISALGMLPGLRRHRNADSTE